MQAIFYRQCLCYAKSELKTIDHLLVRADNQLLVERSIDEILRTIKKIEQHLLDAKINYLKRH